MSGLRLRDSTELWVWGFGLQGQLGLGDDMNRMIPTIIGTETTLGESHVLTASYGYFYTMVVTKDGALWTFGMGEQGALGHNDRNTRLVPTRVEAQHFGNANVVSTAGAYFHSAAVTEDGTLFTWGIGDESKGLGDASGSMWVPTRVDPALIIGPCHNLQPIHALAFAMGTHSRLCGYNNPTAAVVGDGNQKRTQRQSDKTPDNNEQERDCVYVAMPGELVRRVIEACETWPGGRTGELDGLVRMLGGRMMRTKGPI